MRSLLPVPKRFRILISLTGQRSLKFSLSPFPILLGLSIAAVPLAWAGKTFYALQQSHDQLSVSAAEVMEELEVLDQEVEKLRQRAGLSKAERQKLKIEAKGGKGGVSVVLNTKQQLQIARARLPILASRLKQQVQPALEKTLQAEEARNAALPQGKPTKTNSPISSDFGLRPGPFGGSAELHDGIDLLGDYGAPIYATANGKVERAEYSGGYGYHVVIQHGYGYQTLYAHLSKLATRPKASVKRGQLIGYMGSTGRSTGTHLHYSIYRKEKAVDPKPYMFSKATQPAIAQSK
ncbi:M23 family metallopeptidase [Acaryochloris sp. IP29b_bin.148]|uniref:M23 family metallopeptidase n=1 Tax=Acaryochloris sp. IP29b_bin.148 TaxID=2969218 RepID=UPI002636F13C|nr:M23 family metallopeptidase [Acaryochloris sp. IP29b_bin.148]